MFDPEAIYISNENKDVELTTPGTEHVRIAGFAIGPAGVGVPKGGTTGQFLRKAGGQDYQTIWATIAWDDVSGKPTTIAGYNISDAYTKTQVDDAISAAVNALISGAPGALDTLNELADAMGDDPNFAATMTNELSKKLDKTSYNAADVLAKLLTVDGPGSGVNADLLDGLHAAAFARVVHQHTLGDITDVGTSASKNVPAAGNAGISEVVLGNDTRLTDTRHPKAHQHVMADITDAGSAAKLNVSSSGDATASQVVKGNDSRLSDTRHPKAHQHVMNDITDAGSAARLNVPSAGDATDTQVVKGNDSRLSDTRHPKMHQHQMADITDAGSAARLNVPSAGNATPAQIVLGSDTRLADTRHPKAHVHPWAEVTGKPTTFEYTTNKNIANGYAGLDSNGKLATSVLPSLALTDVFEAANEAEMLALTAQRGDVVIRSDLSETLVLSQEPASAVANWKTIITPTAGVTSVAGQVGAVTLGITDIVGLQSALNNLATEGHIHSIGEVTGLQAALNSKQASLGFTPVNKAGDTITGDLTINGTLRYGHATEIPAGSDLDTFTIPGCYNESQNADAAAGTNYPEGSAGMLTVSRSITGTFVYQTYQTYGGSGRLYFRSFYNSWGNWRRVYTTADYNIDDYAPLVQSEGARNVSPMGVYSSSKISQIWSMGAAYRSAADGSDFGNLYGLAYKHTNNPTGGTMAGGHQMVWTGNGTPQCALGTNIWTSGNVTAYSDARLKENIKPIKNALGGVLSLDGCTFDRIDTGAHQLGVLAQQVLKVFPQLVDGDESGYSVAYGNFAGVFIEAFKEEDAKVEKLKTELKETQETLASVMSRLEELEKRHGAA